MRRKLVGGSSTRDKKQGNSNLKNQFVMSTYIILSKISPDALRKPDDFRKMADTVKSKIREECPDVEWKDSYAVKGQFDVVDVVESADPGQVDKASMIIRSHGRSDTQTMQASPWKEFLQSI